MARQAAPLQVVSFAPSPALDALCRTLSQSGFECRVILADQWLAIKDSDLRHPTVLLVSQNSYPRNDLLSVLRQASAAPILGVFSCEDGQWDEDVLSRCTDFLGWPCHDDELAFRLQRLFGDAELQSDIVSEAALLEEFVSFNMLGEAPVFVEALKLIKRFARCDASVLIQGETGTGKELAARAIHYLSSRRDYPFIPISCGAMPDNLIENELFGHEKGAFTDAKDKQVGLVAEAHGGTLFLDEVDALSAKAQATLLRFLELQEYKPLGSKGLKKANTRIVAATNADITELAEQGSFRKDLVFRLDVLAVQLPELRERKGDVKLLAEHFIREQSARYDQPARFLHPQTLAWMEHYHWPGNVRELENLLHRECLLAEGPLLSIPNKGDQVGSRRDQTVTAKPFQDMSFSKAKASTIAAFEKSYLCWLMAEARGNVSLAAKRAGKERSALRRLLRKHGIDKNTQSMRL